MSTDYPTDSELQERAKQKLRQLLHERCFVERWESVAKEMKWVITGRSNAEGHQKILPEYCYHIFELYARTIFKVFRPMSEAVIVTDPKLAANCKTIEEAKTCMVIDWKKLGSVAGMGERGFMFFENEVKVDLKREGLLDLTPEQEEEACKLILGDDWENHAMAGLSASGVAGSAEEIEKRIKGLEQTAKKGVSQGHEMAREWEPGAVTKYHAGVASGSAGFLDKDGKLKGERKIKHNRTYEVLLMFWPEIEAMLNANPPKKMEDLWDWLTPFSHAKWIEIEDLDQLVSLCRPIKLKLKKPGAPRKPREC
ncbi:MAG TPA: hypothetical protein VGO67_20135 [Verrucomicrobiae bacterium]